MINKFKNYVLFFFINSYCLAQTITPFVFPSHPEFINPSKKSVVPYHFNFQNEKEEAELIIKPSLGIGVGMFSFYGDLYAKHFQSPTVSRLAYELTVSQQLNDFLQFNFYVLRGKLGANENDFVNNRHLNFESQITAGGINLLYNFNHFLPKDRDASPYITLGIESFEFLSKTDLYDKYGNQYYYWNDGSIRNMAQNNPNTVNAKVIQRDYIYESDIREKNFDGFGKYPERSWAIPVGIGFMYQLNDNIDFKMGATMHFTFTDYIDGVTQNSIGGRQGNSKKDKFMMTSFSVHYNFGMKDKAKAQGIEEMDDVDFLALDNEDMDKDGIPDVKDDCQGTPEGVPVDSKGCPLDDDKDGVPNYKDDEVNTPFGSIVDEKGVQLNDSIIAYRYNIYNDSTGAFAKVETHEHNGRTAYTNLYQKEYSVSLGTFKKGLPPELMTKFLSVNDISSTLINDSSTIYTAGKFNDLLSAEKRKQQLVEQGLTDVKVVYKQNGKFADAPVFVSNVKNNLKVSKEKNNSDSKNSKGDVKTIAANTTTKNTIENKTDNKDTQAETKTNASNPSVNTANSIASNKSHSIVLRVQLGAYRKRLSKNVFHDINDLIEIKTDDGLYKYMTGSFSTIQEAAKHKVEMILNGYEGAFLTAYKDGKRVSLQEAGATISKKEDNLDEKNSSAVNKKLVVFRVQLGMFKNQPPADKQAIFSKIKNIEQVGTTSGSIRYLAGSFNDYETAKKLKEDLVKEYGISDAFIIAFFNNETISIQDALELLK